VSLDVFQEADAFIWQGATLSLSPIKTVQHVPLAWLKGIDHVADILVNNTNRFATGLPANNALLWGARGTGKSSLVKACIREWQMRTPGTLKLIEIAREELPTVANLLSLLKEAPYRFILFCDDMSFDHDDASYKSLKAVLDGGIAGRPENVLLYATSNRRHLLPRKMADNLEGSAIHPGETVEECLSLSDRFGLWLGFHSCNQETYNDMVTHYANALKLPISEEQLLKAANEWSITRGARSGRVAWQFIQDLAGKLGVKL
jgi:predicted AAA+ superfamily ATPase